GRSNRPGRRSPARPRCDARRGPVRVADRRWRQLPLEDDVGAAGPERPPARLLRAGGGVLRGLVPRVRRRGRGPL
ncbi:MAG: hypothetical protein AVDCRST_MAG59-2489, partial [uncultured Thermomicrobiales bacterium]